MHLNHAVYQALLPSADAWGLRHGGEIRDGSSPQTCTGVAAAAIYLNMRV